MNRTAELVELVAQSGLSDILVTKGVRYFEAEQEYSKLDFASNHFRLSSIELYDLKRSAGYFRIHHHADAPDWLKEAIVSWEGFRNANKTGVNFNGEPLDCLNELKALLLKHR